jgi:hypothetical protein
MRTTGIRNGLAAVLAGALVSLGGSAVAQAQSPQGDNTTSSVAVSEAYVIKNLKSGKVLTPTSTTNGATVVQQPQADLTNELQYWFNVLDEPYWSFENFEAGRNLGINGASTASGAVAIIANGSSDTNQDWTEDSSAYSGNYFALKNRKSGLCLGISGASTANGAQAAQFPCDGSANQGWELTH